MALDKFEKRSAEVLQTIVPIENLSDHELNRIRQKRRRSRHLPKSFAATEIRLRIICIVF